jgi:hypothetical protein
MGRSVARGFGSLLLVLAAGCGLFGGEDTPAISLTPSSTTAVLQQAASTPITIEFRRTNFDGPIALEIVGTLPTGVTALFSQNPVTGATTTLTITASGTATPGTAALTVTATGEGIAEKSILIDVTVNLRGSHTVALSSSSMNVAQGGGGQSTVLLARQNSNAGSVTLTATGAPSGMTVSFGESPTTASATTVTVAATGSVAPGSYNISISGAQPGLTPTPNAATLAVTVIAPPATVSMSVPFCQSNMPVWFAYLNDGFLWQRVNASGNSFTFNATEKLAIAFTFQNGGASDVRFYFATRSELAGITDRDCVGTKNHTGTMTNVGAGQTALVAMGPAFEVASGSSFLLEGVPDRALDLVSTRGTVSGGQFTPDRMVVRRGVNLATSTAIPAIDFQAGDSFAPVSNTLSIAGVEAGENVYSENVFQGTTATSGLVYTAEGTSGVQTMHSVPASVLGAGDMSELYIDAYNTQGTVAHTLVTYFGAPADRTETLGPLLTTPTVTVASTAPYVRERGQLSSQSAYNTAARFVFLQGSSPNTKFVVVVQTAGYLGGALPATWDLTVPDLTGVTGFTTTWMHASGQATAYSAEAFSAPGSTLFGGLPTVGQVIKFAFRQSTVSTSVGAALQASSPRSRATQTHRGILNPPPQYLRR